MKRPLAIFLSALLCILCGRSAGKVQASTPTEKAASGSLHIWEDTPDYPGVVAPLTNPKAESKKKPAKAAPVSWDAWSVPIGNGRLGAVFLGGVANELV